MTGTILNAVAIFAGGIAGLVWGRQFSAANQAFIRLVLAVMTIFFGLRLTWVSINGSFLQCLKQLLVVVLAMIVGKLGGRLMRLQKISNRIGQFATRRMSGIKPEVSNRFNDGFTVCSLLFCAGPLAVLGAVQDGTIGYWHPLAVKALMDGLAAMGFVAMFGWGVTLSAFPVFVYQGTITIATAVYARPFLEHHGLIDPVNATGGLLVFSVALIMLGIKKIELTDYLPSLAVAPLLAWLFR